MRTKYTRYICVNELGDSVAAAHVVVAGVVLSGVSCRVHRSAQSVTDMSREIGIG